MRILVSHKLLVYNLGFYLKKLQLLSH